MESVKNIDFMFEMAFNKKVPQFYSNIKNPIDGSLVLKSETNTISISNNTIYNVFDIPTHLKVFKEPLNNNNNNIGTKSIIQHKGYYIDLNGYENVANYLKNQFGKTSRQALRSGKNRLENCFDISYKMYFGTIDKIEYNNLFVQFYEMLKLRAVEKGILNKNLKYWELYTSKVYDMILKKEASLFVIYDGTKPINISLNMHINDVVFLFITTYDIDYSKFRVGHTNWVWLIDWFIKNNIKLVDFSKGNTTYKKRWANKEYDFEYHLFYDKTKISSKLKATLLEKKLRLLQELRNRNINDYFYATYEKIKGIKKYIHIPNHEFVEVKQFQKTSVSKISIQKDNEYSFLRPIIYQHLFLTSTNVKEVQLFHSSKAKNTYFVKSEIEILKLTVDFD